MMTTSYVFLCIAVQSTLFKTATVADGKVKAQLSIWPTGERGLCPLRDVVTAGRADQMVLRPARNKDVHRITLVHTVRPFGLVIVRPTRLDVHRLSIEARDAAERP
jgi:hypothetical protein